MITIRVRAETNEIIPITVEEVYQQNGLAVHHSCKGYYISEEIKAVFGTEYCITHITSGRALTDFGLNLAKEDAITIVKNIANLLDWTLEDVWVIQMLDRDAELAEKVLMWKQ